MTLHHAHPRQRGFSMVEVLIAVLVFSLGMLGLAGLLIFAIQSNHVAYLRTQATFLAHNMADRMGANPAGLWGTGGVSAYTATIVAEGTPVPSCAAGCDPAELATHDIAAWSQQLHTFLPKAAGNITCDTDGITYVPPISQTGLRPPYGGTCTMQLTWSEAGSGSDTNQQPHSFEWVFQP